VRRDRLTLRVAAGYHSAASSAGAPPRRIRRRFRVSDRRSRAVRLPRGRRM